MDKVQLTFAGGGGFLIYYLGVAKFIQENYVIDDNVILSGCSAGVIPVILLRLNKNIDLLYKEIIKNIINKYNGLNIIKKNIYNDFKNIFIDIINNDENFYKKFNYNTYISISEFKNYKLKNNLINIWESNEDFINTLTASGYLPFFGKKLFYSIKNKEYLDGGLTVNRPVPLKNKPSIVIHYKKWRKMSYIFWKPFINDYKGDILYNLGYNDALKNKDEFNKILKAKK